MTVYLLRHGRTAYNDGRRYQGRRTDVPLSPEGEGALVKADFSPEAVYVSPLCRARQTAARLFPDARQIAVDDLAEMDFGAFEGRAAREMESDAAYRAWVDGGCLGRCPGGEDLAEFSKRVRRAVGALVERAAERGEETLALVAHGGTVMAAMARFALPERGYFDWNAPCGGGYALEYDAALWRDARRLRLRETMRFAKGGEPC